MSLHIEYPCPVCKQWVKILPTTPHTFRCPWCNEMLRVETQLRKLVTAGSHWDDDVYEMS